VQGIEFKVSEIIFCVSIRQQRPTDVVVTEILEDTRGNWRQ
jgi:hypothetical protein